MTTTEIEDAIGKVENLFRAITGRDLPEQTAAYAPIPAERDPVQHVQEQMDRLMQLLGTSNRPEIVPTTFTPPMSVWESGEELLLSVDLPGVARQNLEVSVQGNVVIVVGRRLPPTSNVTSNVQRPRLLEHPMGMFRRAVTLPVGARLDQLTASLKDGVLTLRVPREVPSGARTVQVS